MYLVVLYKFVLKTLYAVEEYFTLVMCRVVGLANYAEGSVTKEISYTVGRNPN